MSAQRKSIENATLDKIASFAKLEGHIKLFEGAVYRNDASRLAAATEAAHAALQPHLDVIASIWAIAQRDFKR